MKTILVRSIFGCICLYFLCSRAIAQSIVTTIAGGGLAESGTLAVQDYIDSPGSIVVDGAGGFYFSSDNQSRVYHVDAFGTLSVVAAQSGVLAIDTAGNLYIGQPRRVLRVTPGGIMETAVVSPIPYSVDEDLPTPLGFHTANGLAVDAAGNIFIADAPQHHVLKVSPDGNISRYAGQGPGGSRTFGGDDGPATAASLDQPTSLAIDAAGNLFIADSGHRRIRKVTPSGTVTTVAGNGTSDFAGDGGLATAASFVFPRSIALDGVGNLYIADSGNPRVRKVDSSGIIRTVAGTLPGGFSGDGGLATSARFTNVAGIAADFAGNIFVADAFTFRVRKVDNSGVINTVAGIGQLFFAGDGGSAKGALLRRPQGVAVDETGTVYIADTDNNRIRKVTPQGVIDTIAGDGTLGNRGDAGPARLARFAIPSGVVVDRDGSLLIFDSCNFRLRRMGLDEIITNFANVSSGLSTDTCTFDGGPTGQIAVDNAGNVYVAEDFRNWVRVFLAGGGSRIVAGTGNRGFSGDGGAANLALLDSPRSVAVDVSGNVFIADSRNARIRMVTPGGTITTFAGNGVPGFSGDGGPASAAQLNDPSALAFDRGGNLLIAGGNRVRRVTPAGIITTVAGNGQSGFAGDGGLAIDATFGFIASIATDSSGNVLIADTDNNRIRKVTLSFDPPTLGSVTPSRLSRGATLDVTFTGTNLVFPLAIDAGNDIVVSNVRVFGASVVVTLAISPDAALGPRSISVTTSFGTGNSSPVTILPTMPDLSITSSRNGYFAAGFSGTILVEVRNVGGAAATGPVTVDGTLPTGLRYLSGTGTGWVCEPAGETIRCANAGPLPAGISTTLTLSVAAPAPGLPSFVHSVTVSSAEDVVDDNNAFSENPMIAQPPAVSIALLGMVAGRQGGVRVSLAAPFPHDVTGSVSVAFTPNAVILSDDPAIQFETGGRQIAFTVSANTLVARFSSPRPDEIGIQTGTVAGTLTFNGELNAGLVQKTFSSTAVIPNQPPVLQSIRSNASALSMTLSSTAREVSELILEFKTTPRLQLACGSVPGCSVSGSTLRFDVQSLFENWYRSDSTYGSLTTLTLPWAIQGSVRGAVSVKLRNSQGQASVREAPIP